MATGSDWLRVAEYVRERRTELDLTQTDVQAAGGPSTATQRLIEGGLSESYQPAILRKLERALGWERGSIRAIRAGGEPVLAGREDVRSLEAEFGVNLDALTEEEAAILARAVRILRAAIREQERSAGRKPA